MALDDDPGFPAEQDPELPAEGVLDPGLSAEHAADTMYPLTAYDVYRSLLVDSGPPGPETERLVAETLDAALLSKT